MPILLIDGHEMVGWVLVYRLLSEGLRARFEPPRSAAAVIESAGRVRVGVVLLELALGHDDVGRPIDGAALVAPLSAAGWRVLVLTGSSSRSRLGAALAGGAVGWVPKNASFPDLLLAIREAREGRSITSPTRRRELIELHLRHERQFHDVVARLDRLTVREREVLARLAAGQRARTIAEESMVSPATVRTQVHAVLTKLRVTSQLEAVALYRRATGR